MSETRVRHENSGQCSKCLEIILRYPGFYEPLFHWFLDFQKAHPEAHVSCAGRGEVDQEAVYLRRASNARFGQSAHNYNAALDLFEMTGDRVNIFERHWFYQVLAPNVADFMTWYGRPGSRFLELPHVEVTAWKDLVRDGKLTLIGGGRLSNGLS